MEPRRATCWCRVPGSARMHRHRTGSVDPAAAGPAAVEEQDSQHDDDHYGYEDRDDPEDPRPSSSTETGHFQPLSFAGTGSFVPRPGWPSRSRLISNQPGPHAMPSMAQGRRTVSTPRRTSRAAGDRTQGAVRDTPQRLTTPCRCGAASTCAAFAQGRGRPSDGRGGFATCRAVADRVRPGCSRPCDGSTDGFVDVVAVVAAFQVVPADPIHKAQELEEFAIGGIDQHLEPGWAGVEEQAFPSGPYTW